MAHPSAGRMRRWLSMRNVEVTARSVIGGLALHIVCSDRTWPSSQRRKTRWVQWVQPRPWSGASLTISVKFSMIRRPNGPRYCGMSTT